MTTYINEPQDPNFFDVTNRFLQHVRLPGGLVMCRVGGSRGFNLNSPASDWDYYGVWTSPLPALLGFRPPPFTITGDLPNHQFFELSHFCKLLRKGNPMAIEALYGDKMMVTTPAWDKLRLIRHRFLSKQAVESYVHYAENQHRRFENKQSVHSKSGKPTEKWWYHIIRILKDAQTIAEGHQPQVWKSGEDRDFLLNIRAENLPESVLSAMMRSLIETVRGLRPYAVPDHGDEDALEKWMLEVRGVA